MSNNAGVFAWIRDSVRRAVLLGFSDAVEQLGTVPDREALVPQLQAALRQSPGMRLEAAGSFEPIPSKNDRKRLGRTLGQIQAEATPSARPSDA